MWYFVSISSDVRGRSRTLLYYCRHQYGMSKCGSVLPYHCRLCFHLRKPYSKLVKIEILVHLFESGKPCTREIREQLVNFHNSITISLRSQEQRTRRTFIRFTRQSCSRFDLSAHNLPNTIAIQIHWSVCDFPWWVGCKCMINYFVMEWGTHKPNTIGDNDTMHMQDQQSILCLIFLTILFPTGKSGK